MWLNELALSFIPQYTFYSCKLNGFYVYRLEMLENGRARGPGRAQTGRAGPGLKKRAQRARFLSYYFYL